MFLIYMKKRMLEMDKKLTIMIFLIGILVGVVFSSIYNNQTNPDIQAYFSPEGSCEQIIIHYILERTKDVGYYTSVGLLRQ